MSRRPVWALVVSAGSTELSDELAAHDLPLDSWEIADGARGYAALVAYDLGSEGVDADLARRLSQAGGPVFDVRLEPDIASVRLFESGAYVQDIDTEPRVFLAEHGFELPAETRVRARSVIVVEGANPREIAAELGVRVDEELHVEPLPTGALVYSESGDVSALLRTVARSAQDRTVYLLGYLPGDHFLAHAVRGEEDVGVLYDPPGGSSELPPLESVRGERDARGIARALGVRPELLGLTMES